MSRVMRLKNGQTILTVPSKLAKAVRLKKGEKVEFEINKKGNLEIVRVKG